MKKIAIIIGIALLALFVYLVYNTLTLASKQLTGLSPAPEMPLHDSISQHLTQAIQFRTVSYGDPTMMDSIQFEHFIDFVENTYPLVHKTLKQERVNSFALLYTWPGKDTALLPALLMGHYDVVPIIQGTEKMWAHKPFDGTVADGYVYGRGSLDDKSTVIGLLEAVEHLLKQNVQPERTIYLAFGHDEEASGKLGGKQIAELLEQRKLRFEYVMDEGGTIKIDGVAGITKPIALIGIAEKGYTTLELTSVGEGGHSSMPPPQTSVGMLAEAIDRLQKNPFPAKLGGAVGYMMDYLVPEMSFGSKLVMANQWLLNPLIIKTFSNTNAGNAMLRTTIAPTIIQAGVKDNVLPIESTAKINFRILPGDSVAGIVSYVNRTIANEKVKVRSLQESDTDPSVISDTATFGFRLIHHTINRCFPEVIVAPFLVLGGTDSRHFSNVCDHIYRFMPIRLNDEDLKRIHGTNERTSVTDFKNMVRFYAELIKGN